jgi:hypothetical protein
MKDEEKVQVMVHIVDRIEDKLKSGSGVAQEQKAPFVVWQREVTAHRASLLCSAR